MGAIYRSKNKPDMLEADAFALVMMGGSYFKSYTLNSPFLEGRLRINYNEVPSATQIKREDKILHSIESIEKARLDRLSNKDVDVRVRMDVSAAVVDFLYKGRILMKGVAKRGLDPVVMVA